MIKWIIIAGAVLVLAGIIVLIVVTSRKKGQKNAKKLEENISKFKSENEAFDKKAKADADKKKEEDAFANITLTDDVENEFEDVFLQTPHPKHEEKSDEIDFGKRKPRFDLQDDFFTNKAKTGKNSKKNRDEEFEAFLNEHSYSRRVLDNELLAEIKNLSPKTKAIILGNLFNKFED